MLNKQKKSINGESSVIPAILKLKQIVQKDLDQVNQLILSHVKSDVTGLIPEISGYIANAGGKRIRPILALSCAKLFNISTQDHILLATAVEFIHTATLLHDDVIDEGVTRRGVATANQLWGNKASILVGDYLFGKAFNLMVQTSSIDALKILSTASVIITEGEVWQLSNISNLEINEEQYFGLIRAKTAQLFSAACESGAIISNANKADAAMLAQYGMNLGMAFQIIDDILDYTTQDERFGKAEGGDFKEGKITLPLIIALNSANKKDKKYLIELIGNNKDPESFKDALEVLKKYQAFDSSYKIAKQFASNGLKNLETFSDSEEILLLRKLIVELLARSV